jgi:fused signal recognition particle receptor
LINRLLGREDRPAAEGAPLADGLAKSRSGWRDRMSGVFGATDITDATWEELELQLVAADVGPRVAAELVEQTRALARDARVSRGDQLPRVLRKVMVKELSQTAPLDFDGTHAPPTVILVIGVNGSGKTTSIAKLADRLARAGKTVVLIAADTFRAAAIEQLVEWGARAGAEVIAGSAGADPAAVVFDGLSSRAARQADFVIVDTAGRLHTQANLMAEMGKIERVCGRVIDGAPHVTLLVIDATSGQNGLVQAKQFAAVTGVDGLVLAKLDSSAKGGVAFAIRREMGVPISFVGTGERLADLADFETEAYVDGLLGT